MKSSERARVDVDTWVGRTARSIASAVRDGHITAREVVQDHLSAIDRHNPELNAIVTVCAEDALAAADDLDRRREAGDILGPLAGVPFTVKDTITTAGVRTTAGSRALASNIPMRDATAVAAFKAAGAVLVGKTNAPEFGACGLTRNDLFGVTTSPLIADGIPRSPGGSSGGESASVAAGLSVLGLGTDFGGSVRWPAHCTGLVSIRPTLGRVDTDGQIPGVVFDGYVLANPVTVHGVIQTIGPLARNLPDLELALNVLSNPALAPVEKSVDTNTLDIRWAPGDGTMPVDDEIVDAVSAAAHMLRAKEYNGTALSRGHALFSTLRATESHADIRVLVGTETEQLTSEIRAALDARPQHLDENLWAERAKLIQQFLDEMGDVLIMPVASILAPPLGQESFTVRGRELTWMDVLASCRAISVLGLPSVVVPIAQARNGLPVGLQIVARPWREADALAVAARIASLPRE
ncbi:amidase [Rhodococcoides kyotonense]|uniref:amidase n=1 Tax=Rhodococcoides kyotonense TaxID=398843 RepID=A0A177Y845_9NOCA|nr:amidase [Rhodococcus kyotonensis]OAK51692.1 glutamyl-tRNA amidotransferase [Rhodococcus kyotonensis]